MRLFTDLYLEDYILIDHRENFLPTDCEQFRFHPSSMVLHRIHIRHLYIFHMNISLCLLYRLIEL